MISVQENEQKGDEMRRIKLVLAALAVMVATFVAVSSPAMAKDLNCHDARGDLIRCNGTSYTPVHNNGYNYWNRYNVWNPYRYSYHPYWYSYYPYWYSY
jgi:hypothetical protein